VEKKILRLLIVDDSPDDAELASTVLRRHGYMLKQNRVQDLPGLQTALDKGHWDAAVCEHALAHLNPQIAYDTIKRAGLDLPFLILARAVSDEDTVKVMRAGAHDVVLKSQIARLGPALERELKAAEDRRQLHETQQKLREVESKSRAIVEGTLEALCYLQDGMHVEANGAYLELFGYANLEELTGVPVMNLIDKTDQARFKELLRKPPSDRPEPQEFIAVKHDGTRMPIEATLSAITLSGEKCLQLLVSDISKRRAVETKLQYLNQHDPLTGLYNRHHFLQELGKAVEQARRGEVATLLYMDLEQLTEINEAVSYAAGDRLLIKVARLLREHLGEQALLSRFGGDEFAALIHGRDETAVAAIGETLRKALKESSFSEGDKTYRCDCKLAVTRVERNAESAQKVLSDLYRSIQRTAPAAAAAAAVAAAAQAPVAAAAPQAPAQSKPAPAAPAVEDNDWPARLQQALDKDSFTLVYQPIVNLHGEPAEFFEVRVRLVDKDRQITAGDFLPAAEKCGLSAMIDRWVVRNGIEALASLHRDGRDANFFVHLSGSAFKDADLLPSVIRWLREASVRPDHLVFEVDETAVHANPAGAATFVKAARKIGAHVAVDNFGRNLNKSDYLRDLPVEYLKVDGRLIRDLAADPVSQAALRAVVQAAQNLGLKTVAKSVEKAENLAALWNFGVDYVEGHYFEGNEGARDFGTPEEATLSSEDLTPPSWANSRGR
jgi:diguanylate cyclase (GGDEF)-like protein/PAS domain S-box-containing protein